MRIAVSIGHHPTAPGARALSGVDEYALLAPVAGFLIRYLHEEGAEAYMVPGGNLGHKVDWVNRVGGLAFDLVIEIHGNADPDADGPADPEAHGCEVLYCNGSERGEQYANVIQRTMVRRLGVRDRGAKPAGFFWLRKTRWPAVIVEPAFLDEARGEAQLSSEPHVIAKAITRGVLACLQGR